MLRFYMDHHVHGAITDLLRRRHVDCLTLHDDLYHRRTDELVLQRATQLGRVLFTQDRDFLRLTDEWKSAQREFSGVVYSEQLRISIGQAVNDLELVAHAVSEEELRNTVMRIPI